MSDVISLPMNTLTHCEKLLRDAVHAGSPGDIEKGLDRLRAELLTEPRRYPSRIRHRVSSLVVSVIRDLDGMISPKDFDDLLNRAYYEYNICDCFERLMEISGSFLTRAADVFTQETSKQDSIADVIAFLKRSYAEDISLQQLADRMHFSAGYLSAQLKKETGMSYSSFITDLRMQQASKLLLSSDIKVSEVAASCGYNDSSYFNRVFCRYFRISPEQYRKAHKKW